MKIAKILWRDLLRQVRLFPLAVLFFTALPLAAQVPSLINYQGRLTDGSGSPVSGNRTMAVRLYDAATGGNMTYEETIGTVGVANGTYSFQFGASGNGIVSVLSGQDFLALTVNGTEESTRTRLLAVPYALKAKESADTQTLNSQVTSLNGTVAGLSASQTTLAGNVTTLQAQTQSVSESLSAILAEYKVLGLSGNLTFDNSISSGLLTISNSGFRPLTVSGISYPAGFSGNWSGTIAPGGSQSVTVTFTPTAEIYSGNISVTSDATSGTTTIAVSGQGTRLISLSGDLAFGNGTVNVPNQRNFTIANTGNMDLTVSGISYPAGFSGNWTGTIAPGASQSVTVTFTPTAVQSYGGNLSVASNATGGSGLLALSGIGRTAGPTGSMITVQSGTLPQGSQLQLAGQTVATFQIGKYEVTWGEWREVRDWAVANGYSDLAGVGGTYPAGAADNFPVCYVNWYDIAKWSNAKSEKEGLTPVYQVSGATYKTGQSAPTVNSGADGYRLPTEKEWEWAARGGTSSQGYTYSGSHDVSAVAWYYDNSSDGTKAVGTKEANELGIHDMSGNIWEWCEDVAYTTSRRLRGGNWLDDPVYCRVSLRSFYDDSNHRKERFGFRLARSPVSMVSVQGGTLPWGSQLAGQTVSAFQIGKYEVTWGEWKEVRDWAVANGYSDLAGVGGTYPAGAADNFPVCYVNWFDIAKWSNAKSEKEGLAPVYQVNGATYKTGQSAPTVNSGANGYRLPTEKEWEWAAWGGASSQGYTYSGSHDVSAVAWYYDNSSDGTKAVGTKVANELGIYDMSGNVFEWCEEVVYVFYRSIRSGGWNISAFNCRVADRGHGYNPDYRDSSIGFRLARSPVSMVSVQGGTLPWGSQLAGQTVSAFQIGKYEVTWGEWKEVRDWAVANGYSDLAGVGGTYPAGAADNFPVCRVNWYDVVKWSNAKSEKEGLTPVYQLSGATYKTGESAPTVNSGANGYRLPTEKEWEWAARGGTSSQGYNYSGSDDINAVGWYVGNSGGETRVIGQKAANGPGVYDMSGNVSEWCWDIHESYFRRIRGGSWYGAADLCAVAVRGYSSPYVRYSYIGFRLARSSGN